MIGLIAIDNIRPNGNLRHTLYTARYYHILGTRHYRLGCEVDGLLTRPTLPIYRGAGHRFTQYGRQADIAGYVRRLSPNLRHTAKYQIVNFLHGNTGFFDQSVDHHGSQVDRMNR